MREEDKTIFEYRMKKEIKYVDLIKKERLEGKSEKISFFTKECGYVDGYIYRPENYDGQEILPIIFNFHGGGMVLGYCEQDGKYCQSIANDVHAAVINVDYPIAPEYKFPLPIYGTYEFAIKVKENSSIYKLCPDKLYVMGHSAGGYLSAGLCVLDSKKRKLEISGLVANYPNLRQLKDPSLRKVNYPNKAISVSRMKQYYNWYFNEDDDPSNILASPINADSSIFPPSLIISAEYDIFKDEDKEFADNLRNAGVEVEYRNFTDCMHGFTHDCFDEYNESSSREAWSLIKEFLKKSIASVRSD